MYLYRERKLYIHIQTKIDFVKVTGCNKVKVQLTVLFIFSILLSTSSLYNKIN